VNLDVGAIYFLAIAAIGTPILLAIAARRGWK
jgi:hypothetical protein